MRYPTTLSEPSIAFSLPTHVRASYNIRTSISQVQAASTRPSLLAFEWLKRHGPLAPWRRKLSCFFHSLHPAAHRTAFSVPVEAGTDMQKGQYRGKTLDIQVPTRILMSPDIVCSQRHIYQKRAS